jgi:hypothetical protein
LQAFLDGPHVPGPRPPPTARTSANRAAIETYLRYHFEQGLSERQWTVEEVFAPDLPGT